MNTATTATDTSKTPCDPRLAPLRPFYRAAKSGAPIDAKAFANAVCDCIGAGADVSCALRAFWPLVSIRLDFIDGADGVALVRRALSRGGMLAALRMCSKLGWSEEWAAAMTAHYGPTGIHEDYLDADGRPTMETLAKFPQIADSMRAGQERFESLMAWQERQGNVTRWECVVEPRKG
jgi:hypothetical protein